MKNIIKIGIVIIGILLVINFLESFDDLIKELLKYFELKKIENYTYSKQPAVLKFILPLIGLFLKLILGLFLMIKPTLFANIYVPNTVESDESNWTLKLILAFTYCLGIYLMVFGLIGLIEVLVREFQFTEKARETSGYIRYSWTSIIPKVFRIMIGYILYKSSNEKLYSKK